MKKAMILASCSLALAGCMHNRTETNVWVMGEGNYVNTDAGSQDKPINAGVEAQAGDAALKTAAALAGGGAGAAVAGPAGAAAGAGAGVLAQQALTGAKK